MSCNGKQWVALSDNKELFSSQMCEGGTWETGPVKFPLKMKEDIKTEKNTPVIHALKFVVSFGQSVKQKVSVCKACWSG